MAEDLGAPHDLTGFRDALFAQHRERSLVLKRALDDDLADIIAARRLEVEGIVHRLHRSAENRLKEGLSSNRRYAERRMKARRAALQNDFLDRLDGAVAQSVSAFRRSEKYRDAMKSLLLEAQERLPGPAVVLVEKGDAFFLTSCGDVPEVREELQDTWGGLVLIEAGKEGGRIVDNTFRTRWRRLSPVFLRELREHMESIPDLSFPGL